MYAFYNWNYRPGVILVSLIYDLGLTETTLADVLDNSPTQFWLILSCLFSRTQWIAIFSDAMDCNMLLMPSGMGDVVGVV